MPHDGTDYLPKERDLSGLHRPPQGVVAASLITSRRAIGLVNLVAAAYLSGLFYAALSSTPALLLPEQNVPITTLLVCLVYLSPLLAAAAFVWLRPGKLAFVTSAAVSAIPLVPFLFGQARQDWFWAVAIGEGLIAAAIVVPLVCLWRLLAQHPR
jgi:hypothetical protein